MLPPPPRSTFVNTEIVIKSVKQWHAYGTMHESKIHDIPPYFYTLYHYVSIMSLLLLSNGHSFVVSYQQNA